jgi:WS/DGAT/MGAT family acyltransferase
MVKQLTGLDTMFLFLEKKRTPLEVSTIQIYDPGTVPGGRLRFKEILATFESRIERSKVFRRKLLKVPFSLDYPYWVEDKDFDIEYHVRHIALPRPGDWRQLMIQVSRLQSQHLDHSRPLWEVYMIEGLDNVKGVPPGSFALFMKMHHATIDGTSGKEIQAAIHDLEPLRYDLSKHRAPPPRDLPDPPNPWGLLAKSPVSYLKNSTKLVLGMATVAPGLIKAGLEKRKKPDEEIPRSIFNVGKASANRVIDGRFWDLEEVKAISRAVENTKINDVVLAIVSGAMRRYLLKKKNLPPQSLITAVPIDIRKDGEEVAHDNMVSTMNVSLHSDIEDPIARMHAIHESARESKRMTEIIGPGTATAIPMNLPAPIAQSLLPAAMELMLRQGITPFNTLITNVAGIQRPIYLAGAEMVALMGIIPVTDGMGLTHSVFSYNGMISLSFTACREMLPDPDFYAKCIEESYVDLRDAALGKPKKPARKNTVKRRKTTARKSVTKKAVRKKTVAGKKVKRAAVKATPAKKAAVKKTTKKKALKKKAIKKKASKK